MKNRGCRAIAPLDQRCRWHSQCFVCLNFYHMYLSVMGVIYMSGMSAQVHDTTRIESQRTTCRIHFPLPTSQVPRVQLRSSDLVASVLTAEPSHWPAFYFRGKGSLRQTSVQLSRLLSLPHECWDDRRVLSYMPSPRAPLFMYLYSMCSSVCLYVCMCTMCMFGACRGHSISLEPVELELHTVASHHSSMGNGTRVLCKSSKCPNH